MFVTFDDKKDDQKLNDECGAEKNKGNDQALDSNAGGSDASGSWTLFNRDSTNASSGQDSEVGYNKSKSRLLGLWNGLKFSRQSADSSQAKKLSNVVQNKSSDASASQKRSRVEDVEKNSKQNRDVCKYTTAKNESDGMSSKHKSDPKSRTKYQRNENETWTVNKRDGKLSPSLGSYSLQNNAVDYKHKISSDKSDRSIKSRDSAGESFKAFRSTRERRKEDSSLGHGLDVEELNKKIEYIDARWRSLYLTNEKQQELYPCPTCGRTFSEDAAFRHFPICSKVKEKNSSNKKVQQTRRSKTFSREPSIPNVHSAVADTPGDGDTVSKKSTKPVVYTFQKAGLRLQAKLTDGKPQSESSEHMVRKCERKNQQCVACPSCGNSLSNLDSLKQCHKVKKNRKNKDIHKSDGVQKSANIWRKSTKDFVKSNAKLSIITRKRVESNDSEESEGNKPVDSRTWNVARAVSRVSNHEELSYFQQFVHSSEKGNKCYPNTISKRRVDSNIRSGCSASRSTTKNHVVKKVSNTNNSDSVLLTNLQSCKDASLSFIRKPCSKKNEKSCTEMHTEKFESCRICGQIFLGNVSIHHTALCERIKKIEESVTESNKVECPSTNELPTSVVRPPDPAQTKITYNLSKHSVDSSTDNSGFIITSLECPCCRELLDLQKVP